MNTSHPDRPDITASVVTHNNESCLPVFLDSLTRQEGVRWEALFFDNASQDATCEVIRRSGVGSLQTSRVNAGFGRGHNHNAVRARGRYLALLNPDIAFAPDLLAALAAYLDAHPDDAAAGPDVIEGMPGRPFPPRRFYPGEGMLPLEPGLRRRHVAWLNGCCILFRRDAYTRLGGFDPDFFVYQTETDLCLRARRAGDGLGHVPHVRVHHLHRQSQQDDSDYQHARRIFDASATFWSKHFHPADVFWMVRFQYALSRVLLALPPCRSLSPPLSIALTPARLRARHDVCRAWLDTHARSAGRPATPLRIALRQCHLALEWIRQRRFPLDDY